MTLRPIAHIARPCPIRRELEILSFRRQLIQVDFEIEVLLVCGEIEMSGKKAAQFYWVRERITDEHKSIGAIDVFVQHAAARTRLIHIGPISEIYRLRNGIVVGWLAFTQAIRGPML